MIWLAWHGMAGKQNGAMDVDLPESGYLGTLFFNILLIAAAYSLPISEDESLV